MAGEGEHYHAALPPLWLRRNHQPRAKLHDAQTGHPPPKTQLVAADLGKDFKPNTQLQCSCSSTLKIDQKMQSNCIDTAQNDRVLYAFGRTENLFPCLQEQGELGARAEFRFEMDRAVGLANEPL